MATSFTVSCLQTQPKPDFDSAIEEGLKLAEKSLGENPSIICFPEYCGGLKSKNGRFIPPHKDEENHPFLNEFTNFANSPSKYAASKRRISHSSLVAFVQYILPLKPSRTILGK